MSKLTELALNAMLMDATGLHRQSLRVRLYRYVQDHDATIAFQRDIYQQLVDPQRSHPIVRRYFGQYFTNFLAQGGKDTKFATVEALLDEARAVYIRLVQQDVWDDFPAYFLSTEL